MSQDQIAGDLQQDKGNEEDEEGDVELVAVKTEFFLNAEDLCVPDIDPVEERSAQGTHKHTRAKC